MSKPFSKFGEDMEALAITIEANAGSLIREAALAAQQALVSATPVDTGRARANWQMSVDDPIVTPREAYVEGERGSTGSANTAAALSQGRKAIQDYSAGSRIHITNNLDYIDRLNNGSSAQAPGLFVERAVQAATAAIEGFDGTITINKSAT